MKEDKKKKEKKKRTQELPLASAMQKEEKVKKEGRRNGNKVGPIGI